MALVIYSRLLLLLNISQFFLNSQTLGLGIFLQAAEHLLQQCGTVATKTDSDQEPETPEKLMQQSKTYSILQTCSETVII